MKFIIPCVATAYGQQGESKAGCSLGCCEDISWLLQGLGDLAAHLVAFHNMGASPAHDDPFTSDVKVDFDGDKEEGSDAENSPHAQSQQRNVAGTTFIEDRTFENTAQVLSLRCHQC